MHQVGEKWVNPNDGNKFQHYIYFLYPVDLDLVEDCLDYYWIASIYIIIIVIYQLNPKLHLNIIQSKKCYKHLIKLHKKIGKPRFK